MLKIEKKNSCALSNTYAIADGLGKNHALLRLPNCWNNDNYECFKWLIILRLMAVFALIVVKWGSTVLHHHHSPTERWRFAKKSSKQEMRQGKIEKEQLATVPSPCLIPPTLFVKTKVNNVIRLKSCASNSKTDRQTNGLFFFKKIAEMAVYSKFLLYYSET